MIANPAVFMTTVMIAKRRNVPGNKALAMGLAGSWFPNPIVGMLLASTAEGDDSVSGPPPVANKPPAASKDEAAAAETACKKAVEAAKSAEAAAKRAEAAVVAAAKTGATTPKNTPAQAR